MKRILTCCIVLKFLTLSSDAIIVSDDPVKEERDALISRTDALKKIDSMPLEQSFTYLGEGVRKMGDPSIYHLRKETTPVYVATQQKLISIPGHAEYFGKRIRDAYAPLKTPNPGVAICDAQNEMMYSFGTLKNLPSPETVKVLGGMLSETWRMEPPPPLDGDYTYTPSSLALSAVASALIQMPFREPPNMPIVMAGEDPEVVMVHPWQSWWKEIKSGERSFSFKGQKVEYRFNPDGTWETLAMANPPDDGPKLLEPVETSLPTKPQLPPKLAPVPTTPARNNHWWIIGVGISACIAAVLMLKRRQAT